MKLSKVFKMLDECLPRFQQKTRNHCIQIRPESGGEWVTIERGARTADPDSTISRMSARRGAKKLKVEECARRELPEVWG